LKEVVQLPRLNWTGKKQSDEGRERGNANKPRKKERNLEKKKLAWNETEFEVLENWKK
jgi:hypothetical protein